jgi:hypothetical protein
MLYNKNETTLAGTTGKEVHDSQKLKQTDMENRIRQFDWRDVRISEQTGNYIECIQSIDDVMEKNNIIT